MIFWIPIATIAALSIIYWNDLGFRPIAIYVSVFIVSLFVPGLTGINPYVIFAFQALLAGVMYIHVRSRTM